MTIVVTGASGHVGANLVRLLLQRNQNVRVLVHKDSAALDGLDVDIARGDVRDVRSLVRAFSGCDTVFHLAALISLYMDEWPRLRSINIEGTANVLSACRRNKIRRLVHFSSIEALSQSPFDVPLDENRSLNESRLATPYGRSKAAAESLVREAIADGFDAVIINPTAMIGPYDYRPSAMGQVLLDLAAQKLPALVNGGFNWVDVRDVVAASVYAAERASPGSRFVLSGHWMLLKDLARLVESITGAKAPRFVCPMWLARAGAPFAEVVAKIGGYSPRYSRASLRAIRGNRDIRHTLATSQLGFKPRPLHETLADTYEWFGNNQNMTPRSYVA